MLTQSDDWPGWLMLIGWSLQILMLLVLCPPFTGGKTYDLAKLNPFAAAFLTARPYYAKYNALHAAIASLVAKKHLECVGGGLRPLRPLDAPSSGARVDGGYRQGRNAHVARPLEAVVYAVISDAVIWQPTYVNQWKLWKRARPELRELKRDLKRDGLLISFPMMAGATMLAALPMALAAFAIVGFWFSGKVPTSGLPLANCLALCGIMLFLGTGVVFALRHTFTGNRTYRGSVVAKRLKLSVARVRQTQATPIHTWASEAVATEVAVRSAQVALRGTALGAFLITPPEPDND